MYLYTQEMEEYGIFKPYYDIASNEVEQEYNIEARAFIEGFMEAYIHEQGPTMMGYTVFACDEIEARNCRKRPEGDIHEAFRVSLEFDIYSGGSCWGWHDAGCFSWDQIHDLEKSEQIKDAHDKDGIGWDAARELCSGSKGQAKAAMEGAE